MQNVPIPLRFPREAHEGLWGGEAVIKGYQHRGRNASLIPHWWVPSLHRTVLYSEVLDRHLDLVVTQRAEQLVHEHHGLDMYLLKVRQSAGGREWLMGKLGHGWSNWCR